MNPFHWLVFENEAWPPKTNPAGHLRVPFLETISRLHRTRESRDDLRWGGGPLHQAGNTVKSPGSLFPGSALFELRGAFRVGDYPSLRAGGRDSRLP